MPDAELAAALGVPEIALDRLTPDLRGAYEYLLRVSDAAIRKPARP